LPAPKIRFAAQGVKSPLTDAPFYRNWLRKSAYKEGKDITDLQYVFCSDDTLLAMNIQFLNHRTLTDILTFDYAAKDSPEKVSGEIYISIDRVRDNAKTFGVSVQQELSRVLIHGLLHLCGYRDKTTAEKKEMRSKEDHYLALQKNIAS